MYTNPHNPDLESFFDLEADLAAKAELAQRLQTEIREEARRLHIERYPEAYEQLISDSDEGQHDPDAADSDSLTIVELSDDPDDPANAGYAECRAAAERAVARDTSRARPPSDTCLFCDCTLPEVGGSRMTGTQIAWHGDRAGRAAPAGPECMAVRG